MIIFSNNLVTNFKKRSKIKGFITYYVGSSPIFRISSMSGENPRSLEFIKVSGFYFSSKILLIVINITHSNKIFSNFLVTVFSNKKEPSRNGRLLALILNINFLATLRAFNTTHIFVTV